MSLVEQLRCARIETAHVADFLRGVCELGVAAGERAEKAVTCAEAAVKRIDDMLAFLGHDTDEPLLGADAMPSFNVYLDDVRAIIVDKRGESDAVSEAMADPFVGHLLVECYEHGANAGYAAVRVREYIATRGDLDVARNHEAGPTGGGKPRGGS